MSDSAPRNEAEDGFYVFYYAFTSGDPEDREAEAVRIFDLCEGFGLRIPHREEHGDTITVQVETTDKSKATAMYVATEPLETFFEDKR